MHHNEWFLLSKQYLIPQDLKSSLASIQSTSNATKHNRIVFRELQMQKSHPNQTAWRAQQIGNHYNQQKCKMLRNEPSCREHWKQNALWTLSKRHPEQGGKGRILWSLYKNSQSTNRTLRWLNRHLFSSPLFNEIAQTIQSSHMSIEWTNRSKTYYTTTYLEQL